jgi:hypothetical protein
MQREEEMVAFVNKEPLFSLGQIVGTPGALEALEQAGISPASLIQRHVTGDFGDLCDEDKELNLAAIQDGSRILSAYRAGNVRLYVITEAKDDEGVRSVTTILRVEEY